MKSFAEFIKSAPPKRGNQFKFISLFSGAGIGDYGLKMAGGKCLSACEIDENRSAVHFANFGVKVWGNLRNTNEEISEHYKEEEVDLLIATPPCQSFSTANSRRGLREDPEHATKDERNTLFFEALRVARNIRPKVVFFENVPNFLMRKIKSENGKYIGRVHEFLSASLTEYAGWHGIVCFSQFGAPQRRKRSIAVFIRKDIGSNANEVLKNILAPSKWGTKLKDTPKTILEAIADLPVLDGSNESTACDVEDVLHQVPVYTERHYKWISNIPPGSGKSAWENDCEKCGNRETPFFEIKCKNCNHTITTRPHVVEKDGSIRAIKGFKTSYKRMLPNELAPTITTASGHFSSDLKLHPTQNRVLSARECARLQAIPDTFKWPSEQKYRKAYLFREMIGEAIPPIVTYQLGMALKKALKELS